jgi:hypothetical protein
MTIIVTLVSLELDRSVLVILALGLSDRKLTFQVLIKSCVS